MSFSWVMNKIRTSFTQSSGSILLLNTLMNQTWKWSTFDAICCCYCCCWWLVTLKSNIYFGWQKGILSFQQINRFYLPYKNDLSSFNRIESVFLDRNIFNKLTPNCSRSKFIGIGNQCKFKQINDNWLNRLKWITWMIWKTKKYIIPMTKKNTQDEAHYFVVFSVIKIVFCHFAGNLIFINNKTVAQVDQRLRLEMFIDQMWSLMLAHA